MRTYYGKMTRNVRMMRGDRHAYIITTSGQTEKYLFLSMVGEKDFKNNVTKRMSDVICGVFFYCIQ